MAGWKAGSPGVIASNETTAERSVLSYLEPQPATSSTGEQPARAAVPSWYQLQFD